MPQAVRLAGALALAVCLWLGITYLLVCTFARSVE